MILSLQTTTFSAFGGIPTYNRLVCRVLNAFKHSRILIATDHNSDIPRSAPHFSNLKLEAFANNRLALIFRFLRLGLTHEYKLLLIGHVNYAPLGWFLKKLKPRMRYGVILYGIEAWQKLSPTRRRGLQDADFIISISEYTLRRATQTNDLKTDRVYLLPNALETDIRETNFADNIQLAPTSGSCLLSVCRLDRDEQYKGVDKVIAALPEVAKKVPDVKYVVVGGGTDLERHRQFAEDLGVSARVEFLGFLADSDLRECYRKCDVFVMPSAGEGFGFVFLEAMHHKKPIVAANSGGAPEVVQDGVNGRLVEYSDEQGLADALTELCLDSELREQMGNDGYEMLQHRFNFSRFNEGLSAIISLEEKCAEGESLLRQTNARPDANS